MAANTHSFVLLGLDIGTTNCKLIAFSPDGQKIAEASGSYDVMSPQPGFAELDVREVLKVIRSLFFRIAPAVSFATGFALAISAQGEAFVPVDAHGEPLMPAPVSMDMRGREIIAGFCEDQAVRSTAKSSGQTLNALTSLAKLLWMKSQAPEILGRTARVLCMGEYLQTAMGLSAATDLSMASRMGLLNNQTRLWSNELIDLSGISTALLPVAVQAGTKVGTVSGEMGGKFGLNAPLTVHAGGHDQACAALGAGVLEAGTGLYSIGTTEAIAVTLDDFNGTLFDTGICVYPHVLDSKYIALIGSQSGGRLLSWLSGMMGVNSVESLLDGLPDQISAQLVLPHFAGTGSVLGDEYALGRIEGLSFDTSRHDLILGFLEGITFEQALGLERIRRAGTDLSSLRAVGGGSRSGRWMQIKSDITGLAIDCVDEKETACAGAAILAGIGSGEILTPDIARQFVHIRKRYSPRKLRSDAYARKLALYKSTYRQNLNSQQALHALQDQPDTGAPAQKEQM